MTLDDFYASEADKQERGPQYYGGDASIIALRAFRRYHKDATLDFRDGLGVMRWMTKKQARIHAVLARMAVTGEKATMTEIARETRSCTSTVSRAVLKFQAWSMFGAIVWRGRNGGLVAFARFARDHAERFALRAQARLARLRRNVASTITTNLEKVTTTKEVRSTDARFSSMGPGFAFAEPFSGYSNPYTPLSEWPMGSR